MMNEYLERFLAQISPFRSLWNGVRIVVFAGKKENEWVSMWTRITLIDELTGPVPRRLIRPTESFFAYEASRPIEDLDAIIDQLTTRSQLIDLPETGDRALMYLPERPQTGELVFVHATQPFSWMPPQRYSRDVAAMHVGARRESILINATANRYHVYDCLADEDRQKADHRLSAADPPFGGFDDLYRQLLPGVRYDHTAMPTVELIAPLPFAIAELDGAPLVLAAGSISRDELKLSAFYSPTGGAKQYRLSRSPQNRFVVDDFEWPAGAASARAVLFYRDEKAAEAEIRRWPISATLRIRVAEFFDENHEQLRTGLLKPSGKGGEEHETAVSRLFCGLGIPVGWYGRTKNDRRPDLAGVVDGHDGIRAIVVLIECTRERVSSKLSPLKERARELTEHIANGADVLPVIVTPSAPVESDYDSAAEHGVSLVGREEIQRLLQLFQSGSAKPFDTIGYLKTLQFRLRRLGL